MRSIGDEALLPVYQTSDAIQKPINGLNHRDEFARYVGLG